MLLLYIESYKGIYMRSILSVHKRAAFLCFAALLSAGCGGGNTVESSAGAVSEKYQTRTLTTTITKGNYINIAKFAYITLIEQNMRSAKMDVVLPGRAQRGIPKKSVYTVNTLYSGEKVRKIVVKNYQERLEVKFLDNDMVKIIVKMPGDSREKKMTFTDFMALR